VLLKAADKSFIIFFQIDFLREQTFMNLEERSAERVNSGPGPALYDFEGGRG